MSIDPLPRRIPKLKVRNRIDDLEPPAHLQGLVLDTPISPSSSRNAQSHPSQDEDEITTISGTISAQRRKSSRPGLDVKNSYHSDASDETQDTVRPASAWDYPRSPSVDMGRTSDFSAPSFASASKKKSRLWGSLLMKEPSTNAWKDFAELQKQEQALKGNQMKQLVDKKLPEYVPKVNSKWNGLPDHAQPPKGKPWKTSMDLSRSSHSRASGYSDDAKRSNVSRPGSGHSGHSSNSSSKTAKRATSKQSGSSSSSKSKKVVSTNSNTMGEGVGPAMSTYSLEPPSPIREPSGIPASSLFFPAEQTPPIYASRVNVNTATMVFPPTITSAAEPSATHRLLDSPKIPHGPRSSPAAASREDWAINVVSRDAPLSDEESTPTQERAPVHQLMAVQSSDTTVGSAQTSPILPDSSAPPSPSIGSPQNFHNRFKKQYKRVEEIPQWPLPTKPEDVILETETDPLVHSDADKSHERLSSNSSVDSSTQQSFLFSQTDGTSSRTSSEASSPVSPIPPSSVVHPLGINLGKGTSTTAASNTPPTSPNTRLAPLIAPAFQPGRVKTRPFDLDTIAESDAGSIRAPSLYLSPNRSVVSVLQNEPLEPQSTPPSARMSLAVSRASSEMSEQWYMSPEERTGLGVKTKARAAPWQIADDAGKSAIRSDGAWNLGDTGDKRRSGLIGRFRR